MTNAEAIQRAETRKEFYVLYYLPGNPGQIEGPDGEDMAFARAHELVTDGLEPKVARIVADFGS